MRLSNFLRANTEQILRAWDEFAATIAPTGLHMDQKTLRDHAAQILQEIADDLDLPQTDAEQVAKSRGEGERAVVHVDSAAETHADTRILSGFGIDAMLTEYRALRASVLRMWSHASDSGQVLDDLAQMTRFNEAIDQAIAESVARYTEQVARSNDLFIGMLGHDLRNPLGTIRLSAELLKRSGQLTPRAAEPIVNAAKRIESIVESIVDFARARTDGLMPITVRPFHLSALAQNVIEETRVRHPGTTLVLEGADQGTDGEWDEGRMGQLLSNLLENAVLYGKPGSPVTLTPAGRADHVTFTVHNMGEPIPEHLRVSIFEPRQRGNAQAERRAPNGLGLGLYICREIMRSHKGALALRSTLEHGTTFQGILPRHAAAVP